MLRLLKIEWLKIKNYRAFWIMLALFAFSLYGINYIVYSIKTPGPASQLLNVWYQFPQVWSTITYFAGFLHFVPGFILILNMSNEYTFRTNRQNVIDGMSRTGFISGKFLLALALALFSTLVVFIIAFLFGISQAGGEGFSFKGMDNIFYYFIQACSYLTLSLVIAVWLKRAAVSIGVYFLYGFIIENLLSLYLVKHFGSTGYYLPLESADKLISPAYFSLTMRSMPDSNTALLIVALIYIIAGLWFCKYKYEKSDL